MQLLKGKKALITGGTSGIGKAIAIYFAIHGADVAIIGTSKEKAESAIKEIKEARFSPSQEVLFLQANVADYQIIEKSLNELLAKWETVDVLVNNAGITRDALLMKMSPKDWQDVIDVNLSSAFNTCKALLRPMMKARKGKIINISSVIGLTGNAGQVNYAASKSGIIGFTKSLAKEVAKRGINVNCIAPGYIKTPMTEELSDKVKEQVILNIPMGRIGMPADIAEAAVFLASNMSDYITGQIITVDGGMVM